VCVCVFERDRHSTTDDEDSIEAPRTSETTGASCRGIVGVFEQVEHPEEVWDVRDVAARSAGTSTRRRVPGGQYPWASRPAVQVRSPLPHRAQVDAWRKECQRNDQIDRPPRRSVGHCPHDPRRIALREGGVGCRSPVMRITGLRHNRPMSHCVTHKACVGGQW
jgi:hypothetical protein